MTRSKSTYRQAGIRPQLEIRARILAGIRRFFDDHGYLEVQTPSRIPAPAPESHIDAPPAGTWFLHPSPELCMKRLLAGGYARIFQICQCHRGAERGHRHLPEFTLLEWYTAHATYLEMMAQTQALIASVAAENGCRGHMVYQGAAIDLETPWPRLTVADAFARYASLSMEAALAADRFDDIMAFEIEPRLGISKPVFLMDYPLACGALARPKPRNPQLVERFELYVGGLELCNAFSELVDPVEQRRRFEAEQSFRRHIGAAVYPLPERFLKAMADMPAAAGNALGIDRLVMLLADAACIDDVVAFVPEEL